MRIAMISGHASPLAVLDGTCAGGQNIYVAELSAAMTRLGHTVTVYTRRDDRSLPECIETPHGYAVVHVPAGPPEPLPKDESLDYMGDFARYLDARWRTDRPDIVHGHFWVSGIATQLAARPQHIPSVQTFHSLGVVARGDECSQDTSPAVRIKLEKLVARGADWVVAACTDEVFELARMGRCRDRISVVPCGVDLDAFSTAGTAAPRCDRPRIVGVGRTFFGKGFDTVIEALPAIQDAEFVIVGGPEIPNLADDPEVRRLSYLAERWGVADRVVFTGAVAREEMPPLLRSADVVTCTPRYESSGVVALEAMACGVPVVASAVGAMLDVVVHDVTGRLISPRRPRECAEAITAILRDSFLRRSLGLAGRDRARARYSWDRVAADTLRIYDQFVGPSDRMLPLLGSA